MDRHHCSILIKVLRSKRLAAHEIGHALVTRALGDSCWSVSIIPAEGYEGRCVRSGPPSDLTLSENGMDKTEEILTVCERLERLTPELGSARSESSEYYIRSQNNVIALVAGECAETLLHPDLPSLGANHDHTEADGICPCCPCCATCCQSTGRILPGRSNGDPDGKPRHGRGAGELFTTTPTREPPSDRLCSGLNAHPTSRWFRVR
ncbi:hypothetical protein SAMN05443248_2732 [Bradyrhizobium erythrophlei]|uniref:Peptidase family M41 n=1 Tax=Bradyrhizobium erythrophlei TaxID=1437360 RepID=A0A1M5MUJ4_9BRAD|nr:hypothetical protein SAMN05443248_2732 [Bradyrhizobium erythrophlei]